LDLSAPIVLGRMAEVYNEKIANNQPMEKRGPLVKQKQASFMELFKSDLEIVDIQSGKALMSGKDVGLRYECVFRESGTGLRLETKKRFFFDAKSGKPTFCLDFEQHESLVTPRPGTRMDGALGTVGPRTQSLIVLYEISRCKVTGMWLAPDKSNWGNDAGMSETLLKEMEIIKTFFGKVKERRGNLADVHFQDYHNVETIG
jgi:hypothetical protein